MDEEQIKKIAKKLGIPPEEVKERMKARARNMRRDREMGEGGQGRRDREGGRFGRQRGGEPGADAPAAVATTDKYLFVVKGNNVYQFDVNTLKLLNKAVLEPELTPQARFKQKIEQQVHKMKERIEQLRKEGKNEEADKLEEKLKKWLERVERMHAGGRERGERRERGWKNREEEKEGEAPKKENNAENEILF
jgi:hypothetical protein